MLQCWQRRRPRCLALLLPLLLACAAAAAPSSSPADGAATTAPAAAASTAGASTLQTNATASPPAFCSVSDAYPSASARTSMAWAGNMAKVYHNLYHHNKKWYALVDASSSSSSSSAAIDRGMSLNAQLITLPTTDAEAFTANLKVCYVPGVTLFLGLPFPAFPDNLGHWAELLLPLHCALSSPALWRHVAGGHRHIDRIVLLNVRPELMYSWPKEVLGLALEPAVPPWPSHRAAAAAAGCNSVGSSSSGGGWESSLPWDKPLPPIHGAASYEAWCSHSWMVFENVVMVQDRYDIVSLPDRTVPQPPATAAVTLAEAAAAAAAAAAASDAVSDVNADQQQRILQELWSNKWSVGFLTPQLASEFRAAALARHGWDVPVRQQQCNAAPPGQKQQQPSCVSSSSSSRQQQQQQAGIPRTITVLLYPDDYPPVTNHHELVRALEDAAGPYGFKVRTVSLTMAAPFLSHMATMADTGILVGRHGPLLASAVLLPPGAAVLELLPYKWEWRGVSRLYFNMTQSTGRLHHWAWRPVDARWCKYKEPSHARYAGWHAHECQGQACLLVHAQAGLEVDLDAVRQLILRKLPGLLAGHSVDALSEPWPSSAEPGTA